MLRVCLSFFDVLLLLVNRFMMILLGCSWECCGMGKLKVWELLVIGMIFVVISLGKF